MPRPLPIVCLARRVRSKWARARRSFARGKISRQEMNRRLSRTYNHPGRPLWTTE